MTNLQTVRLAMQGRVDEFFAANNALLAAYPPMAELMAEIAEKRAAIAAALSMQGLNTSGLPAQKADALHSLSAALVPLCRKAVVWARRSGHPELIPALDVQASDFEKLAAARALQLMQQTYDVLSRNAAELASYNITAAQIDNIRAMVQVFSDSIPKPGMAAANKVVATAALADAIDELAGLLTDADDLIHGEWGASDPGLVAQWDVIRGIGSAVRRHTGIHGAVTQDGAPLAGVVMAITELGKSATTGADGIAEISKVMPGSYTLRFSRAGLKEVTMPVQLKRGQTADVEVTM